MEDIRILKENLNKFLTTEAGEDYYEVFVDGDGLIPGKMYAVIQNEYVRGSVFHEIPHINELKDLIKKMSVEIPQAKFVGIMKFMKKL